MKDTLRLSLIPWIIGIGLLMENLDVTIINTAIPQMALSLHVHPLSLKIGITSYLLTLAAFIPISGYIADKYGTRHTFSLAIIIFTLGSVLCGFSHQLWELIVGRMIQGTGGALMAPVGRLIIMRVFPRPKIAAAFSSVVLLGQLGPMLGPTVGGALTTFINWQWIFFVNVPFGVVLFILVLKYIPNRRTDHHRAFDMLGFILFAIAAALVTFSLSLLTERAPYVSAELSGLVLGCALLFIFYLHSQRNRHPVMDFKLFKVRTFFIAVVGGFIARIGIGAVVFLFPLLFQLGFHMTAFQSGLLLLPYTIGMIIVKPCVRGLLKRYGFKRLLIINPSLIGIMMIGMMFMPAQWSYSFIFVITFMLGLLTSAQFTYMNILIFVDISEEHSSQATSISSVIQQLANAFSVCAAAGILILTGHIAENHYIDLIAFKDTFATLGLVAISSVLIFSRLKRNDGSAVLG